MDTIQLPPPEELARRIDDCETELKSLKRLLRMSRSLRRADEARARRTTQPAAPKEPGHA
jgi:hypothetical protein